MAGCDVNIDFVYEHARVDLLPSAGREVSVGVIIIGRSKNSMPRG
jgi:hypothetical protein